MSLKTEINKMNANVHADQLRTLAFGDMLMALPTALRKKVPVASAVQLGTLDALALPDDAKALTILRAYARAATAGTGELTVVAYGTTPASGQIAVAPNGDIVTLHADAITDLDLVYQPDKYDMVTLTLPVVGNALAIPASYTAKGIVALISATALVGTVTGAKIVLVPSASAAATGQARLDLAKANVKFASADAVTSATVKLAYASAKDVQALMAADATIA